MPKGTLIDGAGLGDGWHAIELFWEQFKAGEDVVVEDDIGGLHVGRLERPRDDEGIRIRLGRKSTVLDWYEITFIAHAGFPVQSIQGMSSEEAANLAEVFDTRVARNVILKLLAEDIEEAKPLPQECRRMHVTDRPRRRVRLRGGCPFDFDDVEILALHNPGNDGPRWFGKGEEEELVLRAIDGALCLSYNLGHMFYLETDRLVMGAA